MPYLLQIPIFFLPFVVDNLIQSGIKDAKVLVAEDKWYGVTYKEDKEPVQQAIRAKVDSGFYPEKLW
jgi:hypothetical protein